MEEQCTRAISEQEIADAIRSAAHEVFSMMLDLEISAGEMEIGEAVTKNRGGIVALLGFAGDWIGSGTLYCEGRFGCRMASHLLSSEFAAVDEEVLDAVAETANMIIGNVKTVLENKLGSMGLSTPTVIYGRNFEARTIGSQEWVTVHFQSGEDVMDVQISIMPNPRKNRSPLGKSATMQSTACPYCGSYGR